MNMVKARILVVDDDEYSRWALVERLTGEGYETVEAENGKEALVCVEQQIDLVLLDYRLPDVNGLKLLQQFRSYDPSIVVIMLTAYSNVDSAVEVMKAGAFHYATKPFNLDEICLLVGKALETTSLRREIRALRKDAAHKFGNDLIVGNTDVMKKLKSWITKVAVSPTSTVLITGESGTGKDLAAKAIHHNSTRFNKPFINITCSALPDALLESELFGHERGAFTDAKQLKRGLLETADGGTVFFDEIGEMPPSLQAKLLRVLDDKAFKRVGGTVDIRVDVRIVAATHRDLRSLVNQGSFRGDLFYRLNVLQVKMPPLRERCDDIPLLATFFVDRFNQEFNKQVHGIDPEGLSWLQKYPWPGNVRELRNAVERAVLIATGNTLSVEDFPVQARPMDSAENAKIPPNGIDLEKLEHDLVIEALSRTNWNKTRAGALLGLNRDQIRYRIEKFKLQKS